MKKIIALKGKSRSGKTSTIKILHELLGENGFTQTEFTKIKYGDFIAVFSKNDKKIGITSTGDTYNLVLSALQNLINENKCNICVCACRTIDRITPGTKDAILEFSNYKPQFVEKTLDNNESTQETTNNKDAKLLPDSITKSI